MSEQTEMFEVTDERPWANHVFIKKEASQTSRQAAHDALPRSGTQRRKVFDFIESRNNFGATDWEIQGALGLSNQSETPRRKELADQKLIIDSGLRRPTVTGSQAIVWKTA